MPNDTADPKTHLRLLLMRRALELLRRGTESRIAGDKEVQVDLSAVTLDAARKLLIDLEHAEIDDRPWDDETYRQILRIAAEAGYGTGEQEPEPEDPDGPRAQRRELRRLLKRRVLALIERGTVRKVAGGKVIEVPLPAAYLELGRKVLRDWERGGYQADDTTETDPESLREGAAAAGLSTEDDDHDDD